MKFIKYLFVTILVVIAVYLIGPEPEFEPIIDGKISTWDITLDSLERYVAEKDRQIPNLKPGNESRIVWADSIRKTDYALVYLHGFSASPMESNPVHFQLAEHFGMNLYLPLLAGHGRDDINSFQDLTPNDLIKSAKEAIAIGQLLGDQVIVMSCSTGSTLSIYLAAANSDLIDGMIMYSPNIRLNDPTAALVTGPWGDFLIKTIAGEYWNYNKPTDPESAKYWTTTYRTEGLIALQKLLDETMKPEIFHSVRQPYIIGYYYKNEKEKDQTISVEAIYEFNRLTRTAEAQKKLVPFPNAGEHVIANPIKSKQVEDVLKESILFTEQVLLQ